MTKLKQHFRNIFPTIRALAECVHIFNICIHILKIYFLNILRFEFIVLEMTISPPPYFEPFHHCPAKVVGGNKARFFPCTLGQDKDGFSL